LNNRSEDNIPKIILDTDDVKTYQQAKTQPTKKMASQTQAAAVTNKTSGLVILSTFFIYAFVSAIGWWFYQENMQNKAVIASSQARIAELESQLSATGEEMGESTIALKAKLEGLIKKTDTLWKEMDKLWASAWRKNQAQIKILTTHNTKQAKLNDQNKTAFGSASSYIKEIKDKQIQTEFTLAALSEKVDSTSALKTELEKLESQYATLESKSSARDKSQLEVATSLNQLEMSINALMEQVDRLKKPSTSNQPKA